MRKIAVKGETITEILVAGVIAALLFASAIGAFLLIKNVQNYSIAEYGLQRDANMLLGRIIRSMKEGAALHGLRAGQSFTIPGAGEINYISPGGASRSYRLNGASIIYQSPDQIPNQRVIYTAPAGSVLALRFWEPAGYSGHETAGVYIGMTRQIGTRTVSGSASTYVNLRNMSK